MQKLLLFVAVAVMTTLVSVATEPEIPKKFVFQMDSAFNHTNVAKITVWWGHLSYVRAEFDGTGKATNLLVHVGRPWDQDESVGNYAFPPDADPSVTGLTNAVPWQKFAEQVRNRCAMIAEDIFLDSEPWEYIGLAIQPGATDAGFGNVRLIFRTREGAAVTIAPESWKGAPPKEGTKILVGQWLATPIFFPVVKGEKSYFIDPRVMREIH